MSLLDDVTLAVNKHAPLERVADDACKPWELIAIDVTGPSDRFQGNMFLSIIDCFSRFPFVMKLRSASSSDCTLLDRAVLYFRVST